MFGSNTQERIDLSWYQGSFLGTLPYTEYQGRIIIYTDSTATQGRWTNLVDGQLFDESGPRSRRWRRWADDLSEILESQPIFLHIPGRENGVVDLFSRVFPEEARHPKRVSGLFGTARLAEVDCSTVPNLEEFYYSALLLVVKDLQCDPSNEDMYKNVCQYQDFPGGNPLGSPSKTASPFFVEGMANVCGEMIRKCLICAVHKARLVPPSPGYV